MSGTRFTSFYALILFAAVLAACNSGASDSKAGDRPLAKVYDKTLYQSELQSNLPEGNGGPDSALFAQIFIDRWVKDQVMMYEAERNIPKDLNIDQLVRDYRASLIRFNFEEQMLAQKLDSTLTETELHDFYENNKDQFQLESTILKCLLIKLPLKAPQSEMNKIWYSRDPAVQDQLDDFAKEWAKLAMLNRKKWYKLEDIAALLPLGTLTSENIGSRREGTLSDGGFRYYYRVLDSVRGKSTAPFDYVKEQIRRIVLHQRKQKLLEEWTNDLYNKELKRENIKIY